MEIIRDDTWKDIYQTTTSKDSEEIHIKLVNALWRAKRRMEEIITKKKARSLKVIDICPKHTHGPPSQFNHTIKCQSLTMNGKPCQFKAISECGRFCKKHLIV